MRGYGRAASLGAMLLVVGAAMTAVAVGGRSGSASAPAVTLHGDAVWAAGGHLAPELGLTDQDGRRISIRSLRGHVVLLTFLDSRCTKDCPIEGRELARVRARLGSSLGAQLVVVSVDTADTPGSARRFVAESGLSGAFRWHWLMGSHAQLAPVWARYGVTVQPEHGDIAHSTVLYLLDAHGFERAGYLFPFLPAQLADDVRTLAARGSRTSP